MKCLASRAPTHAPGAHDGSGHDGGNGSSVDPITLTLYGVSLVDDSAGHSPIDLRSYGGTGAQGSDATAGLFNDRGGNGGLGGDGGEIVVTTGSDTSGTASSGLPGMALYTIGGAGGAGALANMLPDEDKNGVGGVGGRLQGLVDGVFQPDAALFRSLVDQVNGLARLIEDLRTVSLMEGGHLEMRFARVKLSREIEAIAGLMRPSLAAAGFTPVLDLEDFDADVDVSRIRQALLALMENARRHARPAKLTVRLRLVNDRVRIDVIDCGPGLAPEFAEHAFEPFRRYLENDGPVSGSGLGLSVVLAIAKAHGGTASYRSMDGGACFTMSFSRFQSRP